MCFSYNVLVYLEFDIFYKCGIDRNCLEVIEM